MEECPYKDAFLSIQQADMMNALTELEQALQRLTSLLTSASDATERPSWLEDCGSQHSSFCKTELMCRGSPQDLLRGMWRRHRDKGAPPALFAAFCAVAVALVGEPDPWALAEPPAAVYTMTVVDGQDLELFINEADYFSKGTGRFVYGAAQALSKRVLAKSNGIEIGGKKVLELGCGLGLLGLACIGAGARAVTMTDVEDTVLEACEKNLKRNSEEHGGKLSVEAVARGRCLQLDWSNVSASLPQLRDDYFMPFDVIVATDVCYNLEHPVKLLEAIRSLGRYGLLSKNAEVIILNGWPNRGLGLFEELVGAPALKEPIDTTRNENGFIAHTRKFLNTEDECNMNLQPHLQQLKNEEILQFCDVTEVTDATDERGADAHMRLYRFRCCCEGSVASDIRCMRARAICLRRCAERWEACENNMRQNFPEWLDFAMVEGMDGSLYKALLPSSAEDVPDDMQIAAVEEAMSCHLYRGWPVCETEDVLRVLAQGQRHSRCFEGGSDNESDCEEIDLSALSEAQAWDLYRKWFSDWPRHRAWPYIDFHCRHITLGEIGAALSHVRLIDEAVRDGVNVHLFFEDDARPRSAAVPRLIEEIDILERYGFAWDLIYIRASVYSKIPERPLSDEVPGSRLFRARHRKVTDAYCLSRRGMQRIASSGFRDSLFAFDDFLPSLHSDHPRRDVMLLPCVLKARSNETEPFVGLSFGDEVLSDTAKVGSQTNLSPCVLGDHGSEAELC